MTKEEFSYRFDEVFRSMQFEKHFNDKKDRLLSEFPHVLEDADNNFSVVKDVFAVILERLRNEYLPAGCSSSIQRDSRKLIRAIKSFI